MGVYTYCGILGIKTTDSTDLAALGIIVLSAALLFIDEVKRG